MFRKRKFDEVRDEKQTSVKAPAIDTEWQIGFKHAVLLGDGKHLAAVVPPGLNSKNAIQIWNIQNQECLWSIPTEWYVGAMLLLNDDELLLVDLPLNIHRIKINLADKNHQHIPEAAFQVDNYIYCMTMMQNGSLATGHVDGLISFWDLTKKEKLTEVQNAHATISRMVTRTDGSLVYGDFKGWLSFADPTGKLMTRQYIGTVPITGLVVLPDNTILCGEKCGDIWNVNLRLCTTQPWIYQNSGIMDLVCMPDGKIACLTNESVQFLKPAWMLDYVKADSEIKQTVSDYLPPPLTNLVAEYAANITLFSPPRMPYNRESILQTVQEHSVHSKKR